MLALAAVLGVAVPSLLAPAGTAHAASYRFWGYYQLTGTTWAFAQKGPAETTPKDGAVEGWRFAVSDESHSRASPGPPRLRRHLRQHRRQGRVQARGRGHRLRSPGGRRGRRHSPGAAGRLRRRRHQASGAEVLATVASVRVDKGLTCAVNGYPATGCGAEVEKVPAAAKAADTPVTIPAGAAGDAERLGPRARRGPAGEPRDQRGRPGLRRLRRDLGRHPHRRWPWWPWSPSSRCAAAAGPEPRRQARPMRRPDDLRRPAPAAAPGRVVGVGARPGRRRRPVPPTRSCSCWSSPSPRGSSWSAARSARRTCSRVPAHRPGRDRPAGGDRRAARRGRQRPGGPGPAARGAAARVDRRASAWAARSPSRGCSPRRTTACGWPRSSPASAPPTPWPAPAGCCATCPRRCTTWARRSSWR